MNPSDENIPLSEKQTVQAKNTEPSKIQPLNSGYSYHVFLSHNSKDKPQIKNLKESLEYMGIRCWYDEDEIPPGEPIIPVLEKGIRESQSVIVAIGTNGIGIWEDTEIKAVLHLAAIQGCPIIPLILPGAESTPLPLFLQTRKIVYMQHDSSSHFEKLFWGITGSKLTHKNIENPEEVDRPQNKSTESLRTGTKKIYSSGDQESQTKNKNNPGDISLKSLSVEAITKLLQTKDGLNKIIKIINTPEMSDEKIHLTATLLVTAAINPETEAYSSCEFALKQVAEYDESIVGKALSSDKLLEEKNILTLLDLLQRLGAPMELVINTGFDSESRLVRKQMAFWLESTDTQNPQRTCSLLRALEKEKDEQVKISIKRSLGVSRLIVVDKLGRYLESTSIEVIEQTLGILTRTSGQLTGDTTMKIITLALKKENHVLRKMARELSKRIIFEERHRLLINEQLESSSDLHRIRAMELLLDLPKDEIMQFEDRVVSLLNSSDSIARKRVLLLIDKFGAGSYFEIIANLAMDNNADVATTALCILASGGKNAARTWKTLVDNFDQILPKGFLVRVLGLFSISDPTVTHVLRKSLCSEDIDVRVGAMISLSKIDPDLDWVYNTLISFINLNETIPYCKIQVCFNELYRRDSSVFDKMINEINNKERVLPILGFLKANPEVAYRAIPFLPLLLDSDDIPTKFAVFELLIVIGMCDELVLSKCHQILQTPNREIVMACLKALGVVGDQSSLSIIESLFNAKIQRDNERDKESKRRIKLWKRKEQKELMVEDPDVLSEVLSALRLLRKKHRNYLDLSSAGGGFSLEKNVN